MSVVAEVETRREPYTIITPKREQHRRNQSKCHGHVGIILALTPPTKKPPFQSKTTGPMHV